MKIAEAHIHAYGGDIKKAYSFFDLLSKKGVKKIAIQATTLHSQMEHNTENVYALALKDTYKKADIYAFGSFYDVGIFSDIPYDVQLKKLLDAGCDGIKFLNMKPNIRKKIGKGINDASYDKALSIMEKEGVPVVLHSKDPKCFWHKDQMLLEHVKRGWCYDQEGFLTYEELHRDTLEMIDKHPDLKVILAHFFFVSDDLKEAERILSKYPNVYFDITPNPEMFTHFSACIDAWQEFFIKYQDRIIFGTDADESINMENTDDVYNLVLSALTHDKSEFDLFCYTPMRIRGLDLPKETLEKILYKNFDKLTNNKPKPVNKELLVKMLLENLEITKKYPELANEVKEYEDILKFLD